MRRHAVKTALSLCLFLLLCLSLLVLVPSEGKRGHVSDMLARPTEAPTAEPTAMPTTEPTVEPTVEPTTEPTVEPTAVPTVLPTVSPTESPTERPIERPATSPLFSGEPFSPLGDGTALPKLPMDSLSPGMPIDPACLSEDGLRYQDDTLTVVVSQEKVGYTLYTCAQVTIAHPSQLRTAIAGTPSSPARSHMEALSRRMNAVVAIDGDYYADRKSAYAVRQGQLLSDSVQGEHDLMVIDSLGEMHLIPARQREERLSALQGDIYQCLSFGPILIDQGETVEIPPKYPFGVHSLNPRAGIGRLPNGDYLLVVASGRIPQSLAITAQELQSFLYDKGCVQAYNLDGGASAQLVFCGQTVSPLTPSGERGLYDILYFATAQGSPD